MKRVCILVLCTSVIITGCISTNILVFSPHPRGVGSDIAKVVGGVVDVSFGFPASVLPATFIVNAVGPNMDFKTQGIAVIFLTAGTTAILVFADASVAGEISKRQQRRYVPGPNESIYGVWVSTDAGPYPHKLVISPNGAVEICQSETDTTPAAVQELTLVDGWHTFGGSVYEARTGNQYVLVEVPWISDRLRFVSRADGFANRIEEDDVAYHVFHRSVPLPLQRNE